MAASSRSDENPVALNVIPMVDVIFCLCVFFMCSFKFKQLEGRLDAWMPKDKGATGPAAQPQELRVALHWDEARAQARLQFGLREIDDARQLAALLREAHADARARGAEHVPLLIDSDPRVPWKHVVEIVNLAKSLQLDDVRFGSSAQER